MKLNLPKKNTFWASVIIAAVGFVLYLLTYVGVIGIGWLGLIGFLIVVIAFVLLALGLTIKGL
jgi:hypothetical protein